MNKNSNPNTDKMGLPKIKQYDVFILSKDINPTITKGMQGVILETWNVDSYFVEFVKDDGTNYEFEGQSVFTIDNSYIEQITWTNKYVIFSLHRCFDNRCIINA